MISPHVPFFRSTSEPDRQGGHARYGARTPCRYTDGGTPITCVNDRVR
jgi:hypothetical protein